MNGAHTINWLPTLLGINRSSSRSPPPCSFLANVQKPPGTRRSGPPPGLLRPWGPQVRLPSLGLQRPGRGRVRPHPRGGNSSSQRVPGSAPKTPGASSAQDVPGSAPAPGASGAQKVPGSAPGLGAFGTQDVPGSSCTQDVLGPQLPFLRGRREEAESAQPLAPRLPRRIASPCDVPRPATRRSQPRRPKDLASYPKDAAPATQLPESLTL